MKMVNFLTTMWIEGRVTEERLQNYVGVWITQEEYEQIISTPQQD